MNSVTLIGEVRYEPDLREATNGTPYIRIVLSIPRSDGRDNIVPVVAWGKVAEACARHVGQGDSVAVTGEIESYTAKGGDRRLSIAARRVEFLRVSLPVASEDQAEEIPLDPDDELVWR